MKDILGVVKLYFALPGNEAGGNLHLVLSDGNCDDSALWTCVRSCVENEDAMGLWIAVDMLFTMTEEQRRKFYQGLDNESSYDKFIETMFRRISAI
mgnify:FL=1